VWGIEGIRGERRVGVLPEMAVIPPFFSLNHINANLTTNHHHFYETSACRTLGFSYILSGTVSRIENKKEAQRLRYCS